MQVPACIGAALLTAAYRAELNDLLKFSEEKTAQEAAAEQKKSD